ncbi:MAG: hypothetical protein IIV27_04775, partial [Clostridia bacterium]|nr:hypothetical protein [Clostridia bacterium]
KTTCSHTQIITLNWIISSLAWFSAFQREQFSGRDGERRKFGGRAASARALEPFTAPAYVSGVRGRTNSSLMSFVVWGIQDYLIYWEQQRVREGLI